MAGSPECNLSDFMAGEAPRTSGGSSEVQAIKLPP